jgi:hypothetical protein
VDTNKDPKCLKCNDTGTVEITDPRYDQDDSRRVERRKCPNGCKPKEIRP